MNKPIMILNDQGGAVMDITYDVTATLRAQEHGHQPIVLVSQYYESHPQDSRVTGPYDIARSVSAKYGTGGNNVPLVLMYEIKEKQ